MKKNENKNLVMILDGNDESRCALDAVLKKRGLETLLYATIEEVPPTLYRTIPELVILVTDGSAAEICRQIRDIPDLVKTPLIVVSNEDDYKDREAVLDFQVFDYICAPYTEKEIIARVDNYIKQNQSKKWLREKMIEQTRELTHAQMETIIAMAELAESRDSLTKNHLPRIRRYCKIIAEELQKNDKFSREINSEFIELIYHASALHDIGKIGVRDGILNKYGKLSDDEFELVASHTTRGSLTLETVLENHPSNAFVRMSVDIIRFHHERYDGNGYPLKISGETIPLTARIMALADVYDAVRARRSYKEEKTHEEAVNEILSIREKQLSPAVVDAFMKVHQEFEKIYREYS